MKVLFDTNVILDVLLYREPHVEIAAKLVNFVDTGKVDGVLCANTITTVFYLAAKAKGRTEAQKYVHELLTMFEIAAVDERVLQQALALGFSDYEDAVVHESARAVGASAIVTRNQKDFRGAELPVLGPQELLLAVVAST